MILEFGFKNFFSFKEGMVLSFRLDANCPPHISLGRPFTPVLGIKGANASGKTHILRAVSFLASFCTSSFAWDPDGPIAVEPFFESTEPCEFYVEFQVPSGLYRYELSITETEVRRETLYRTKAKRTKILERTGHEISYASKDFSRLKTIKLRTNASLISTARQYELNELQELHNFFRQVLTNVSFGGLRENQISISEVSEFLSRHEKLLSFVKEFIMTCDVGIADIRIISRDVDKDKKEFFPIFYHDVNGERKPITDVTESSGTKALFRQLVMYKLMIDAGGLLVLDEFDVHLHPHILPKLLALFLDSETNPKGGQLIVSTHDAEILNVLGRYRTYLINKVENESFGYRLDEVPGDLLRNDRPLLPAYNDGKVGGVPRI